MPQYWHTYVHTYTWMYTQKHTHKDKHLSLFKVPLLHKSNSHKLIKCSHFKATKTSVIRGFKDTEYDHKTKRFSLLCSKECLNSDLVNNWTAKLKVPPTHMLSDSCFPLRVLREETIPHSLGEATILFSADWACLTQVGPVVLFPRTWKQGPKNPQQQP